MELGIGGKVAFVSGGSKGVGRATAELFAREGCRVVIAARGKAAIDEAVAAIKSEGGEAFGVSADLTDRAGVESAVAAATEAFGPPDIAVANVHGPGPGNFADLTDEDFAEAFRQMTLSAVYLVRAVTPHMSEQGWGRIVNVGSGAAKEPPPELAHVLANTARASVVTLNKSLANELGPDGITVNTVATGWIGTERMHSYVGKVAAERGVAAEDLLKGFTSAIPARRVGTPQEMAGLIVFLCSQPAGYVSGELINVDGGFHRSAW
jgi:3-oxoacyl-[acyl-carrier protein] reductase